MTTEARDLPDFLYLGAPKCASTWIFRTLQSHPQIYIPPAKDIFYFDRQYHRGIEWYRSFFTPAEPRHRRLGELSTSYLFSEEAAERICETVPNVRLLACIRNPIARAWSAYLFKKRNGMTTTDFETTVADDKKIVEWGLYAKYLEHYRQMFGAEQFRIFLYDDLQRDAVEFRHDLCAFLDVDPDLENAFSDRKVLAASRPRSRWMAALAKRGARLARHFGLANLVGRVKGSSVVSGMLYAPLEEGSQEKMPPDLWKRMADYYAADVARVGTLLGRDLNCWLKRPSEKSAAPSSSPGN